MDRNEKLVNIMSRIRRITKYALILEIIFIQVTGWMYFYRTTEEFNPTMAQYGAFGLNLMCIGFVFSILLFLIRWVFKKKPIKNLLITLLMGQALSFCSAGLLASMDQTDISLLFLSVLAAIYFTSVLAVKLLVSTASEQEEQEPACEEE